MEILFKEIIIGDLGGQREFVSAMYILDSKNHTLFHLYDDRGLEILSKDKSTLFHIHRKFTSWIMGFHTDK